MSLDADIERLLHERRGKRRGQQIDFLCVACDDGENAAANWDIKKGVWGCAKCGVGGPTVDLARRLGLHVETVRERAEKSRIVATYDYREIDGTLRFQVVRYQPKAFHQRRPDGQGGWIYEGVDVPSLYRLTELIETTGRVYVVEGEKDVEAVRERGGTATCNPGGATETGKSKWRADVFNEFLKGRDVVIVPDCDNAGEHHGNAVASSLLGIAKSVRVLRLPGLTWKPRKGPDISDWFAGGAEFSDLEELAAAAPEWEPPAEATGTAVFKRTDAGNAELYAHTRGQDVRYDHQRGRWLIWQGHRWGPDVDGVLWRWAVQVARKRGKDAYDLPPGEARDEATKWANSSESTAKIGALFEQLKSVEPVADRGRGWDAQPMLLGCENGVFNLSTGEFRPGRRDDYITQSTGIFADPKATCSRWLRFLDEVFVEAEAIAFIKRAVGYTITGSIRERVWFLCHGTGFNGKSKFIEAIVRILGDKAEDAYVVDTPRKTLSKSGVNDIPADVARMVNKRLVTCSEASDVGMLDEDKLKQMSGGDVLSARFMRENFFSFSPVLKFWLTANNLPRVNDPTDAFWDRVRPVAFGQRFERGVNRDETISEQLAAELPGILNWAVEGAVEWNKGGLRTPGDVMMRVMAYRAKADPLAEWKTECCIIGPGERGERTAIWASYQHWAEKVQLDKRERLGRTRFYERLSSEGYGDHRDSVNRFLVGLRLRLEGEMAQNSVTVQLPVTELDPISGLPPGLLTRGKINGDHGYDSVTSPPDVCDCDERHLDEDACAGERWLETADGELHCLLHCAIEWPEAER